MADKYQIMQDATSGIFDQHELDITGLSNGVDEYMKATCLELLEYMANYRIECRIGYQQLNATKPIPLFNYKGEWITAQQLFENFL